MTPIKLCNNNNFYLFLILVHATIPTLWSGTNASLVSIFVLHIPIRTGTTPDETPKPILGQLAKEIQIKHRAPVISIALFDAVSLESRIILNLIEIFNHRLRILINLNFLAQRSIRFSRRSRSRPTQSRHRIGRAIQAVHTSAAEAD